MRNQWMKPFYPVFGCFSLFVLSSCSTQNNSSSVTALKFGWQAPQHFHVIETIQKNEDTFKISHDCEFVNTNGEFELLWFDANILEVNGERLADSEELRHAMKPLQTTFIYPSFRINQSGEFMETIDPEEYTKRSDEMLDAIVTNRTDDNRRCFANFAKSETGKQVLNQFSQLIWQTWVEAWTDVSLADGKSRSVNGTVEILGIEVPETEKITNLGPLKSDSDVVNLRYEQDFSGTNFSSVLNNFMGKMAAEMEIKDAGAGPITNQFTMRRQTVLEVQTERQSLKPHWAKRTTRTVISVPGEKSETEIETHEYGFDWGNTNEMEFNNRP